MPYAVSIFGMQFDEILTHGTRITELYVEAAKINEKNKHRDANSMMRRIAENQEGFTVVRVKFSNLLTSYYTTYRSIACDILRDCFSVPSGASGVKTVPGDKLAAVHKMLNLKHGEALLDQAHPVCQEYTPEPGGGIRRVFPPGEIQCSKYSPNTPTQNHILQSSSLRYVSAAHFAPFKMLYSVTE